MRLLEGILVKIFGERYIRVPDLRLTRRVHRNVHNAAWEPMVYLPSVTVSLKGDNNRAKLAPLFSHRDLLYRTESDRVPFVRSYYEKRNLPQFSIYRTFDYLRLRQL